MNNSVEDKELLLKQTQNEIFRRLLPGIISLVVFCAVGIFGNILTIAFYAKRTKQSSTLTMILSLAAVDLAVCIAMILSIWEMAAIVTSYYSVVCKFTHFFGRWSVGSSCFVLWIISIDRHRKICKPFGKQFTVSNAKHFVTGFVIFAILLSVKEFVHYSSIEIQLNISNSNETITGYYCKEIKGPGYRISTFVFNTIDMILFAIIWVTQVVVYTLVIYSLVKIKSQNVYHHNTNTNFERTSEFPVCNDRSMDPVSSNRSMEPASNDRSRDPVSSDESMDRVSDDKSMDYVSGDKSKDPFSNDDLSMEPVSNDRLKDEVELRDKDVVSSNTISTMDMEMFTMNDATDCAHVTFGSPKQIQNHIGSQETEIQQSDSTHTTENVSERYPRRKKIVTNRQNNHQEKITSLSSMELKLTLMLFSVSLVFLLCFTPYFVMIIWALDAGKEYELEPGIKFAIRLPFLNSIFNPIIYCSINSEFRHFIRCLFTKRFGWTLNAH